MSRTIKYRVWDNENKSYNDPYSSAYYAMAQDGGLDFYCHGDHMREADPDVYFVEQYTGLIDKNGKEIYEGDIVRYADDYEENAEVVFDDGGFQVEWPINIERLEGDITCMMEVVGNIHENKELLDGSN